MIILPKKRKNVQPISQVKITSTPGGKIVITGDGYINCRRVGIMTADKMGELYLFNNSHGYTVQFSKSTWNIPIHQEYLTAEQYAALKPYIDKGPLNAQVRQFKHTDGRSEPTVCISRPIEQRLTNEQITDLLQLLRGHNIEEVCGYGRE